MLKTLLTKQRFSIITNKANENIFHKKPENMKMFFFASKSTNFASAGKNQFTVINQGREKGNFHYRFSINFRYNFPFSHHAFHQLHALSLKLTIYFRSMFVLGKWKKKLSCKA